MLHRRSDEGGCVLVCAPFGRDAQSVATLLEDDGYEAQVCADVNGVAEALGERVGAILLTEEALTGSLVALGGAVRAQPEWSDVPFVVLAAQRGGRTRPSEAAQRLPDTVTNSVVLERPLGRTSLLSAVESALRSRRRQFQMRDRLQDLQAGAQALAASEARLQGMADSIDQMIWSTSPDGYHDYFNQRWYEYTGMPEGSTDGVAWSGMFHPNDQDRAWELWRRSLATGEPYHIEYRLRHRSGQYRWVLGRAQPVRDQQSNIVRWYGTCTDIQEIVEARDVLKRSQAELEERVTERTNELQKEMASRSRAEAALRQSHKMEAVGQLTGGIAHDFNNMLTGVIGGLDIIKRRIATGRLEDLDRFIDAASTSATRAAALTARLLAFSRRQSLDPKSIDIGILLTSLEDLLRRTISESIDLRITAPKGIAHAIADANQLENAILNLAINARDAMPNGGALTVEASTVEFDMAYAAAKPDIKVGRYVMVAVSDTGVGMPPELIDKAFEPFFTTKPIGQGTGLGLSMVYGFAHQSGGQVRIHSRPGEGTSVKIYLPATEAEAEDAPAVKAAATAVGGGQTVLLVEDDESVRILVRDVLKELSYKTFEAGSADAALPILRSSRNLDLMISDVGLPGMNGRQLAEIAREHRPDLPILFITGYAENAAIRAGFLGTNMEMITKPFAIENLSAKIAGMVGIRQ